jgi:hypothetical protein
MVRAKFKCWSNNDGVVALNAVTDGSEENKTFWKYTPSGQISMTISNPAAFNHFVPGKEYYVDFTPAD